MKNQYINDKKFFSIFSKKKKFLSKKNIYRKKVFNNKKEIFINIKNIRNIFIYI